MDHSNRIDSLWRRIELALTHSTPMLTSQPAPSASEQAIDNLERFIDVPLPEDVRTSYRRHDGNLWLQLVTEMNLLSLKDIAEWWRILEELRQDPTWVEQPPYYFSEEVVRNGWQTGPIQAVCWHQRWIPIASDRAGNLTCIDLAPAAGGTSGQIIDWDHECGPSRLLFPSFADLLAAGADQIERMVNTIPG